MADGSNHSFVRCEAVKVSYRQTKDGMVVAFAIHPNDMPPELALAPVGTRVLLAVAEIAEDRPETSTHPAPPEPASPPSPSRSEQAKASYREAAPMKQAATRAAMLCKDDRFQDWFSLLSGFHLEGDPTVCAQNTAHYLRDWLRIKTRAEIGNDERAYRAFLALETDFKVAVGELPSPR